MRLVEESLVEGFFANLASSEARVLPVQRTKAGTRHRSWGSVQEDSSQVEGDDWPVPGPRTVGWCLEFLRKGGDTIEGHHERFRQPLRLDDGAWEVAKHFQICQILMKKTTGGGGRKKNDSGEPLWFISCTTLSWWLCLVNFAAPSLTILVLWCNGEASSTRSIALAPSPACALPFQPIPIANEHSCVRHSCSKLARDNLPHYRHCREVGAKHSPAPIYF